MARLAAVPLALALLATACGSDDDSSSSSDSSSNDSGEAATTDGGESATTDGDESAGDESVPWQAGTTGLALDTEVVGTDFPLSWGLVFDPELADQYAGAISLLNDPRETLGAALKYLGYSLNTTSQDELNEATALVSSAKGNLAAFNTDSADDELLEFLSNPDLIPGGQESLELIVDTGDFEINYSDAFVEAKG